jgi:hypothetical protein
MQYASFQDKYHLYFLFDLLPGGDLMDVLMSEAKVITHRTGTSPLPCMATKTKYLQVCISHCAVFGVALDVPHFFPKDCRTGPSRMLLHHLCRKNMIFHIRTWIRSYHSGEWFLQSSLVSLNKTSSYVCAWMRSCSSCAWYLKSYSVSPRCIESHSGPL